MKIGVFDSGVGGLLVLRALVKKMPEYDFVYLGDLKNLPYGNKSYDEIFNLTKNAVEYLFKKENCQIIILACNTASAKALRRIQQEYLPKNFPDRRVLGVIIPIAETAITGEHKRIGILATQATVNSGAYKKEIFKLNPTAKIFESSAPSLVSLIENDELKYAEPILRNYLKPLLNKKINTLILGCTHYPVAKNIIQKIIGKKIKIYSQNTIIPDKMVDYLKRHPKIDRDLSKNGKIKILVTDTTQGFKKLAKKWFGKELGFSIVEI